MRFVSKIGEKAVRSVKTGTLLLTALLGATIGIGSTAVLLMLFPLSFLPVLCAAAANAAGFTLVGYSLLKLAASSGGDAAADASAMRREIAALEKEKSGLRDELERSRMAGIHITRIAPTLKTIFADIDYKYTDCRKYELKAADRTMIHRKFSKYYMGVLYGEGMLHCGVDFTKLKVQRPSQDTLVVYGDVFNFQSRSNDSTKWLVEPHLYIEKYGADGKLADLSADLTETGAAQQGKEEQKESFHARMLEFNAPGIRELVEKLAMHYLAALLAPTGIRQCIRGENPPSGKLESLQRFIEEFNSGNRS